MANTCNFYTFYVCPNSRCIYLQCIFYGYQWLNKNISLHKIHFFMIAAICISLNLLICHFLTQMVKSNIARLILNGQVWTTNLSNPNLTFIHQTIDINSICYGGSFFSTKAKSRWQHLYFFKRPNTRLAITYL